AVGARELGKHRAERAAVHLAIHFLREVARLRGERDAATDPDRAAVRAGPRLARALLRPRLATAAAHFGARLLRLRARATGIAIRGNDLVDQRFVEFLSERRIGHLQLGAAVHDLELHGLLLPRLARVRRLRRIAHLARCDGLAERAARG